MSESSNQQKIIFGILAAAAGAFLLSYLLKRNKSPSLIEGGKKKKKTESKPATSTQASSSGKEEEHMDEDYAKAQELKEKGNQAFKVGKFDDAIAFYTEGIRLASTDQHVLYSNRSAAFAAKNAFDKALEDAQKCIEVNPTWSKGYFRLGKALLGIFEFDKAFTSFLKGLKLDPKSDELKKLIEQTRPELGPGELDTRLIVDNNMIKLYFSSTMEEICKNKLGADFQKVREIIKESVHSKTAASLLDHPVIKPLYEKDAKSTLRVLTQTLLEEERGGEDALLYAENIYNLDNNDPQAIQLLASAKLRSPPKKSGGIGSELIEPLDLIRKAIELDPLDPTLAHTFASIVLRYTSLFQPQQNPYQMVPQPVPIDTKSVLKQLRIALCNPNANALLIADSGIRLWFKLFEDPEIQKMLMEEENHSMQNGVSPIEAYLNGLKQGAFNKLCMEPFFMEALSKIVFNNPALEKVLSPFRTAFSSIQADDDETFEIVSPLIYSMALQCYRNNYSWGESPEDVGMSKTHRESAVNMLKETSVEDLSKSIFSSPKLIRHLSIVSLYEPLYNVDQEGKLYEVVSKLDMNKFHPWLSAVLKKTLLDPHNENVIAQNLQSMTLTSIPKNNVSDFIDGHIGTYWDNAGMAGGRMVKISVKQELDWVFPHYKSIGFDSTNKTKVLIAGCSSGVEIMQASTIYDNIDIVGVDSSASNLAFAIRQNEELGVKAKFYLADLAQLEKNQFNNELFDMIVVHGALNHYSDPMKPWEKLAGLLRPGGIMRVSVFSKSFLDLVTKCRRFLADKFSPPIFESSAPSLSSRFGVNATAPTLPKVLRNATHDEVRKARSLLLDSGDPNAAMMGQPQQGGVEEEIQEELLMIPSFYSLNEFTDLIFHPQVLAFTYTTIGSCVDRLGLKLVGFEFPGVMQETILTYRVDYPEDPNLLNVHNLEKFEEKHPHAFKNFAQSIIFACEKPVSK